MLTILHVSDVHFGVGDEKGEQGRITKALNKAARNDEWQPDICIFSGDLAFSGLPDQLKRGADWLANLTEAPWSTPLFIVPGNHDMVRKGFPHFVKDAHESEDKYREGRATLLESHTHFESFQAWHADLKTQLGDRLLSDWSNPFGCIATVPDGSGYLNHFIGLNTAILSRGDKDETHLAQDIATLNALLSERVGDDDCMIAIGHHPLSWLAEWNGTEVARLLGQEDGANLYLHGHKHDASGAAMTSSIGQSLATLECGAAYQDSRFPQYFSFYRLDFERREIKSKAYVYSQNSGDWVLDELRSRIMVADIPFRQAARDVAIAVETEIVAPPPAPTGSVPPPPGATDIADASSVARLRLEVYFLYRLKEAAQAHEKVLLFLRHIAIPKADLFFPPDMFNRVKPHESAVRKAMTKRDGDPDFELDRITDLSGFRLITYFQSGVPRIVRELLRVVRDGLPGFPAMRMNPHDGVTIHTSRRDNDPLSIVGAIKDEVQASGLDCKMETRSSDTGYSSVHVVFDVDISEKEGKPNWIPVEFQVRNVMEEVWGQLDHLYRYGKGRGSVAEESWQLHLNVLKAQFDTCVQYVDLIRELAAAEAPSGTTVVRTGAQSLSRPELVLEKCAMLPSDLFDELTSAFELWKQADASRQFGGDPGSFGRAANAFGLLLDLATGRNDLNIPIDRFRYIVRMEQGYMLLMSGDRNDAKKAEEIYSDILKFDRPDDAGAMFRLGQSLRAVGKNDDAIETLLKAVELSKNEYPEIYEGERTVIYDRARISLGNCYFRKFQESIDGTARLDLISRAYEAAKSVFTAHLSDDSKYRALNDLIYYAWEQRRLLGPDEDRAALADKELSHWVRELEKEHRRSPPKSYEHYDTLARVHEMLGETEEAKAAARRVRAWLERAAESRLKKSLGDGGDGLADPSERYGYQWVSKVLQWLTTGDERDAFVFAMDLLRDEPRSPGGEPIKD